jgi:hypothetical protein
VQVRPDTQAVEHPALRPGLLLRGLEEEEGAVRCADVVEAGMSYAEVLRMLRRAGRPLTLTFDTDWQHHPPAASPLTSPSALRPEGRAAGAAEHRGGGGGGGDDSQSCDRSEPDWAVAHDDDAAAAAPPPEGSLLRADIEKMLGYMAKHGGRSAKGRKFEELFRGHQRGNVRFNFLFGGEGCAYYEANLREMVRRPLRPFRRPL